jgi:hypothetical protein
MKELDVVQKEFILDVLLGKHPQKALIDSLINNFDFINIFDLKNENQKQLIKDTIYNSFLISENERIFELCMLFKNKNLFNILPESIINFNLNYEDLKKVYSKVKSCKYFVLDLGLQQIRGKNQWHPIYYVLDYAPDYFDELQLVNFFTTDTPESFITKDIKTIKINNKNIKQQIKDIICLKDII